MTVILFDYMAGLLTVILRLQNGMCSLKNCCTVLTTEFSHMMHEHSDVHNTFTTTDTLTIDDN